MRSRVAAYFAYALWIRSVDSGVLVLALLLIAERYPNGSPYQGAIAAAFSLPHLFSPISLSALGRFESVRVGYTLISVGYAVGVAGLGALILSDHLIAATLLSGVLGLIAPLFAGALTALLSLLVDGQSKEQAALSLDGATYGLGRVLGNLSIVAMATVMPTAVWSSVFALSVLLASALIPAFVVQSIPRPDASVAKQFKNLWQVVVNPTMRALGYVNWTVSILVGMMPVLLVRQIGTNAGLALACFGLGGIMGSVFATFLWRTAAPATVTSLTAVPISVIAVLIGQWDGVLIVVLVAILGVLSGIMNSASTILRAQTTSRNERVAMFGGFGSIKIGAASLGAAFAGMVPMQHLSIAWALVGAVVIAGMGAFLGTVRNHPKMFDEREVACVQ